MLIIWGTKIVRRLRGAVADHCEVCNKVRRFTVIDLYEFDHVYFLTVGAGRRVGTVRQCHRCQGEIDCVTNAYSELLDEAAEREMSLDEVIDRTNPAVSKARAARRQIENLISRPTPQDADEAASQIMQPGTRMDAAPTLEQDAELRDTLDRLAAYEGRSPQVTELLQRLQDWRNMDTATRSALLLEANTFVDNERTFKRTLAFLNRMLITFPQHPGVWPAIVVFVLFLVPFFWVSTLSNPCITVTYGTVAIVAVAVAYHYATRFGRRRWMRYTVIPGAIKARVELKSLAELMGNVAKIEDQVDEKIGAMASEVGLLQQEAIALGYWDAAPAKPADHP